MPSIPNEASGPQAVWPLTAEEVKAFLCFVHSDEAQRPSVRSRRQMLPLSGRHVSYGVKALPRRGSDRPARLYVSVKALQEAGLNNYQACCGVADKWRSRLGGSRRGRKRTFHSREFADLVEIVRSAYNSYRVRHPWKEKLPEQDLVYEQWCWQFRCFQQWVAGRVLPPIGEGESGQEFAAGLALRSGRGGRNNYDALAGLGQAGLTACLNSWRPLGAQTAVASAQVHRFVREFFSWVEDSGRNPRT